MLGELATRLSGSSDVFAASRRPPSRSINFVTAHDGFTLADLVSYEVKHNEANGEANRDGGDDNHSWNHGVEGPTDDAAIVAARQRDVRSLFATLLAARGTPMLSMGDELGRTQRGNNNAYAQDNPLAWIDWDRVDDALIDFVAALCALRHAHPALRADRFLTGAPVDASGIPDVEWRLPDGRPTERRRLERPRAQGAGRGVLHARDGDPRCRSGPRRPQLGRRTMRAASPRSARGLRMALPRRHGTAGRRSARRAHGGDRRRRRSPRAR